MPLLCKPLKKCLLSQGQLGLLGAFFPEHFDALIKERIEHVAGQAHVPHGIIDTCGDGELTSLVASDDPSV